MVGERQDRIVYVYSAGTTTQLHDIGLIVGTCRLSMEIEDAAYPAVGDE